MVIRSYVCLFVCSVMLIFARRGWKYKSTDGPMRGRGFVDDDAVVLGRDEALEKSGIGRVFRASPGIDNGKIVVWRRSWCLAPWSEVELERGRSLVLSRSWFQATRSTWPLT